jgi:predicted small lipoprotein YifL
MSISSLIIMHIKISLYAVNQWLIPYFCDAGPDPIRFAPKHLSWREKGRCTPFAERLFLRVIGIFRDRSVPVPVDLFKPRGVSQMKKSITMSLVLAASLGLAACGEKAADDTAVATDDAAATVEGAADGAMEAAEGAADAAATAGAAAEGAADAAAAGDTAVAADKAAEATDAAKEAADAAKGAMEEAKK